MLSWFEKVVPQPPVISSTPVVVEKAAKAETGKKTRRSRKKDGKSIKMAGGLEKKESVATPTSATPDPVSTTESSGRGVLTWISEGLGKVVPQPSESGPAPQQDAKPPDASNQTEAPKVDAEGKPEKTDPSGAEGKPQPSSDVSAPETTGTKTVFNRLLEEFEKMIPQPENVKKTETPDKQTADQGVPQEGSSTKPLVKHRASADSLTFSLFPQSLGGDGGSLFRRIIQGLEKAIPQPVSKQKPEEQQTVEAASSDPGQEISGSKGA